MQIIGIICEYNPFHNGHIYHLKKIKKLYPNSLIILILNGYFLQRGDISLLSKQDKTKIALTNNIDIVLELPFIFGTQSADTFAYKAIEILNYFKVDKIIFGSESNDINALTTKALNQLSENTNLKIKKYLNQGINYPTALSLASNSNISTPNDLLAISYIKATFQINKNIQCKCIKRTNSYHDLKSNKRIVSASNIRHKIKLNEDITNFLPQTSLTSIKNINENLLFTLLKYKINTDDNLELYLDVDEGIENRLKKQINKASNIDELLGLLKTKRYTYNKLKRMLVHILIGFKKSDNIKNLEYIKILGFNHIGQKYINKIKKDISIPCKVIFDSNTYKLEQKAVIIYDLITSSNQIVFEKQNKPIIYLQNN